MASNAINPSPVAAENVTPPASPATPPTPAPPPGSQSRADVAAKYTELYGGKTAAAPATPAEPAPPAEPAAATPSDEPAATPQPSIKDTIIAILNPIVERINQMEERLAAPAALSAANPAATAAAAAVPEKGWIDYLKEGDGEGFQKALTKAVCDAIAPTIANESAEEADARMTTKAELKAFNDQIKTANPDVVEFEDFIVLAAQDKISAGLRSGSIKSWPDYTKLYQDSVNSAVTDVRKKIQRIRAGGKEEGLTVRKDVLSSSPVAPGAVSPERGNVAPASPSVGETPTSYLQRRQRQLEGYRGMSRTNPQ